jgi:ATP adenylyltransferase/5',5'''-P-1,P-4-tetraphosphate phosphorylase II
VVNRKLEAVKSEGRTVGVNCLGFGGTLAVKRESDLEYLKEVTPLKVLHMVSMDN